MPSMLTILWSWQETSEKLIRKLLSFERKLVVIGPGSWEKGKRMGIQEEVESGLNFSSSPDSLYCASPRQKTCLIYIYKGSAPLHTSS